jgi:hypothetical protein
MKELALAVLLHEQSKRCLPSSIRPAGLTPRPRISWLTQTLPFLDQGTIYSHWDFDKNWHDATVTAPHTRSNRELGLIPQKAFLCPSSPRHERLDGLPEGVPWTADVVTCIDYGATSYVDSRLVTLGLVDTDGLGMLARNAISRLAHVRDGVSNTIMLAESAGRPYLYRVGRQVGDLPTNRVNGGGWTRPGSDFSLDGSTWDGTSLPGPCAVNCTNGEDFGSSAFPHPHYGSDGTAETYAFHVDGANVVFGDAAVKFVGKKIDIRVFARLVTRDKGEAVPDGALGN